MKRLLTSLTAFAAAATLLLGSASANSMSTAKPMSHHMMSTKMAHSCKTGQHWVKGYWRKGKMVKGKMTKSTRVHGYCRK